MINSDNIIYFLAGATLPTIAFFLLGRKDVLKHPHEHLNDLHLKEEEKEENEEHDEDDDDEDDSYLVAAQLESRVDPTKWGMKDAPYKMVLCVNQELPMGKGKVVAQACHATLGCFKRASKLCPNALLWWERTGCAKIAVKCPTEDEMINEILVKAAQAGIPYYCVEDAGRTQIAAGSKTVLGLGPAPVHAFEGITSHLKLM